MMKFSKTSKILLLAGVLLIAFASLGFAGSQRLSEQQKINEDLKIAQQRVAAFQLEQLTTQQEQLKKQLSQADAQLKTAADQLRRPNDSTTMTDLLFQVAQKTGVIIMNVSSPGLSSADVDTVQCAMMKLNVLASGQRANLIDFITALNTDLTTGVVLSADITVPDGGEKGPSATVQLAVYNYNGG